MISEKTNTTQQLSALLSEARNKVPFMNDLVLAKALQYLEEKGLPNNKQEDYKYCNLEAVIRREFQKPGQHYSEKPNATVPKSPAYLNLVLLNGKFDASLSDAFAESGIEVLDFEDCSSGQLNQLASLARVEEDAFAALNAAYCRSGVFIRIKKGTQLKKTIRLSNLISTGSDAVLNCRNLILIEEGAEAKIISETLYTGKHKVFLNQVSERFLSAAAKLDCVELQLRHEALYAVHTIWSELQNGAHYDCSTISSSGALIRNNHNVRLSGEHAAAHLYGLVKANRQQLIDNHTLMDHRVAHCESNELYKGIAAEKSTVVFNGKIFVQPHAQKTNAYQSSKNILLSDDASVYAKPQLEIYANDVKCSHGTSTGKMDEEALFYLKARGIGEESARKLLLQAFAAEVLDHLQDEALQEEVQDLLEHTH